MIAQMFQAECNALTRLHACAKHAISRIKTQCPYGNHQLVLVAEAEPVVLSRLESVRIRTLTMGANRNGTHHRLLEHNFVLERLRSFQLEVPDSKGSFFLGENSSTTWCMTHDRYVLPLIKGQHHGWICYEVHSWAGNCFWLPEHSEPWTSFLKLGNVEHHFPVEAKGEAIGHHNLQNLVRHWDTVFVWTSKIT